MLLTDSLNIQLVACLKISYRSVFSYQISTNLISKYIDNSGSCDNTLTLVL